MPSHVRSLASRIAVLALIIATGPALTACNEAPDTAAQPEPPEVSVVIVKPQLRAITRELPGRIAPTRVADVRPRVSGIIVERQFSQGGQVKAGDALYKIDPKPFEVDLLSSEAALQRAEALLEQATLHARRVALLTSQKATTEAENEKAIGTLRQSEAEVAGKKADVARARLNLDYATIRAPIDGIVGAALLSEGALVVQNETKLATIQQLHPIYADFTQSVTEMNTLRRAVESGDIDGIAQDAVKVRLVLDDGQLYPLPGKLLFSDARVDQFTGQVTLRGEFPNPRRELLPGQYVRVQIEQGIDTDAITVPQQAVQRNGAGGSEVFVVKDDNNVAVQAVRTGSIQDGQWLITEGLKAGDKVVIEGFQKFAAGDKVRPQPADQDKSTASTDGKQTTQLAR